METKKIIIVMDSCKEYPVEVDADRVDDFIDQFYNEQRSPSLFEQGSVYYVTRNHFDRLDEHVFINPAHISSIEIVEFDEK
ncbi:hypothetical protein NIE88_12685 [Sporolactobacillus shoreicorticis]|uniref:Uncharacterized protein n=1 Tax=Sporolactobacillus shoreicorticis TaxID=1923877 RepID=A0ABW5S6B3_9BACL|nr:hypothetical protein [Sporolactobacillus shoreicorticis]MCO7126621.1 hypothetical protein [Sporolactobacillus shoreicorticis]